MAKRRDSEPPSARLTQAIEKARGRSVPVILDLAVHRDLKPANVLSLTGRDTPFSTGSTALRQHVGAVRKASPALPAVVLRSNPIPRPAGSGAGDGRANAGRSAAPSGGGEHRADPITAGPPRTAGTAIATVADLGAIVRRVRRGRDLSQAQLSALAGTGRRFVSELEKGKPTVEFERLLAVCRALDIALFAGSRTDGG